MQLAPTVWTGYLPLEVLYPARTQMPSHVAWPEVGSYTQPRGPLFLPYTGVCPRPCPNGSQGPEASRFPTDHVELP